MEIKERVSLKNFNSFALDVEASYYVEVKSEQELKEAIAYAKERTLPIFILGGGTNLIYSHFEGLVIHINIREIEINGEMLTVGAGNMLSEAVDAATQHSLSGLEWAGGLPGTVGGAVRGNAGAFGEEMKDNVFRVWAISPDDISTVDLGNADCCFGYRDSIFKHNNLIITRIALQLKTGNQAEIAQIVQDKKQFRHDRHPLDKPNAGSVFKNVPVENIAKDQLEQFKDFIKTDPIPVVPAAKIIAMADLKGLSVGGAQISDKHTNFIVNTGNATADDIVALTDNIKQAIKTKYGIDLEIEQEIVS